MDWKRLFAPQILERGFDYFISDFVENMEISDEQICAEVEGTKVYEVEIDLDDGEIADMYCSCPYAAGGDNCKHMAAVLYEWEEWKKAKEASAQNPDGRESEGERAEEKILFAKTYTVEERKQKAEAVRELVEGADISAVRSFLASALMEDEQKLLRFYTFTRGETPDDG